MWPELLVIPVCLTVVIWIWLRHQRSANLPPGPPGLPYIGNVLSFGDRPHLKMADWQKQYGDTFSTYFGRQLTVIMSNFETVKKVFAHPASAGRQQEFLITKMYKGRGMVFSQEEMSTTHRRFAISTLRSLGMGKTWLEDVIMREVEDVCDSFRNTHSASIDPSTIVSLGVSHVICGLEFGQEFLYSSASEDLDRLIKMNADVIAQFSIDPMLQVFPFLKYVPGSYKRRYRSVQDNMVTLQDFMRKLVMERKKRPEAEGGVKDYIDAYLQEQQNQKKLKKPETLFDEPQLVASLLDLFGAGTESTSTTILWAFILLLEHPDIMRKIQQEIDSNVKGPGPIGMAHRPLLPLTEATILEVSRFMSIVPVAVAHQTLADIKIDGYKIPKGALLLANLHFIHHDPRYWDNPEVFDPTRFLDADGKVMKPDPEGFVAFSIGKRACVGEALARMEVYLFFANIIHRFNLDIPPGGSVSHDNYVASLVIAPTPFKVTFTPRSNMQ